MVKTIQDLIDNRESLDNFYEERLIALLTSYCKKDMKEKLKKLIKYHFYTTFEGKWYSKKIKVTENTVIFDEHVSLYSNRINQIRKELVILYGDIYGS